MSEKKENHFTTTTNPTLRSSHNKMIQERIPVDLGALRLRQALHIIREEAAVHERRKEEAVRQIRLDENARQNLELDISERTTREEWCAEESHAWRILLANVESVFRDNALRRQLEERQQLRCSIKFARRAADDESSTREQELRDRENARRDLAEERERGARNAAEREAHMAAKRRAEEEMRASRVFLSGDELRRRQEIVSSERSDWKNGILASEAVERADAEARAYERFMNSDEQKQLVAERERKAAEEKAAVVRKELEFKRDQHRLVSRCTHSRAGTSVFVGPLAKKMCLICKVKYDDVQGIYIRMP